MNEGGDVLSALGWGLRKFAWLVALFVVAIGILVPFLLSRGADMYEAQAQVGPKNVLNLPNLDPLPRLGETVFGNGAVADAARKELGLSASASVIGASPGVQLIAAQDNIVFAVVGHASTPAEAKRVADIAASAFTIELNKYSNPSKPQDAAVGEFSVQHAANLPTKPVAKVGGGLLAIAIGLAAGAVAGIGAVALILAIRRPVLDAQTAEQATGLPVVGSVRLQSASGAADQREMLGVVGLCRQLLENSSGTVLLTSTAQATAEMHRLETAMTTFLQRVATTNRLSQNSAGPRQSDLPSGSSAVGQGQRLDVVVADKNTLDRLATLPVSTLTLLVTPRGVSLKALREAATEYFSGGPAGLVFVETAGRAQQAGRRPSRQKGAGEGAKAAEGSTAVFPYEDAKSRAE